MPELYELFIYKQVLLILKHLESTHFIHRHCCFLSLRHAYHSSVLLHEFLLASLLSLLDPPIHYSYRDRNDLKTIIRPFYSPSYNSLIASHCTWSKTQSPYNGCKVLRGSCFSPQPLMICSSANTVWFLGHIRLCYISACPVFTWLTAFHPAGLGSDVTSSERPCLIGFSYSLSQFLACFIYNTSLKFVIISLVCLLICFSLPN